MPSLSLTLGLALSLLLATSAAAGAHRSTAAKAEFQRQQPCPATSSARGPCPGYVVDHVRPLCAGGPDAPGNMQWQTVEAGKVKDRAEIGQCTRARGK